MRLTLEEAAKCLGLEAPKKADGILLRNAVFDSREATVGSLFACMAGEHADGHDFAAKAAEKGAAAILAKRRLAHVDAPVLVVPDVQAALGALAAHWRRKFAGKVVCVTGTSGKTTLRQTLKALLSEAGKTAAAKKNYNNQLGMPCSMLDADGDERFWVMEAGISHAGDMEELGPIAQPDLAVILNVGPGHTEGLGEKGVAWHKTRLLQYLAPGGRALISADYPELAAQSRELCANASFFSVKSGNADFFLVNEGPEPGAFTFSLNGVTHSFNTPFTAAPLAETALAAAAAAAMLGLNAEQIACGFEKIELPPQRFAKEILGKWRILDDAYNANPLSMSRMLLAAKEWAGRENLPLVAVLGEMGELGADAGKWHAELGRQLGRIAPELIFWKGAFADAVRDGLAETPGAPLLQKTDSPEDFISALRRTLAKPDAGHIFRNGAVLLFKGSRCNRLENFVAAFKKFAVENSGDSRVL